MIGRTAEAATGSPAGPAAVDGAGLRLGPLLRHVGERDATIWVETDRSCRVEVVAGTARASDDTFEVAGHHYCLIVLDGLAPASRTAYEVRLDGRRVWPVADSPYPPSLIRTIDTHRPLRLMFGSCRSWAAKPVTDPTGSGQDALGACARRMAGQTAGAWPDALLMLGDQVYADETSRRHPPVHPRRAATPAGRPATTSPISRSTPISTRSHGATPTSAGSSRRCRRR